MSDDLRTLAQAVVDAVAVYEADPRASAPWNPVRDALEELGMFLGGGVGVTHARAILAALNAERAQGYARAMGEWVRTELPQPPPPVPQIQHPPASADSQQQGDDGEDV